MLQDWRDDIEWRKIPGFPDYEMNAIEEVRKVKDKKLVQPYGATYKKYELYKFGRAYRMTSKSLHEKTWMGTNG